MIAMIVAGLFLLAIMATLVAVSGLARAKRLRELAVARENDRRFVRARARWGDDAVCMVTVDDDGLVRRIEPLDLPESLSFGGFGSTAEILNEWGA